MGEGPETHQRTWFTSYGPTLALYQAESLYTRPTHLRIKPKVSRPL